MQDTYNWATSKLSGAAKETQDGVKKMNLEANDQAGKAHSEAKGYVQSATDTLKVHSGFVIKSFAVRIDRVWGAGQLSTV